MTVTTPVLMAGAAMLKDGSASFEHRIEYINVGRCVRFTSAAVAAYLERNKVCVMSRAELRLSLAGE